MAETGNPRHLTDGSMKQVFLLYDRVSMEERLMEMRQHEYDEMTICEADRTGKAYFRADVVSSENNFPVKDARVEITSEEEKRPREILTTDSQGQTDEAVLPAPPAGLSLERENLLRPYSIWTVTVTAPGFQKAEIRGCELLSGTLGVQPVRLVPEEAGYPPQPVITVPDHTLYGSNPEKIRETEVKQVAESGEIVLSRVVVPQTVVVHDGLPEDRSAKDYFVPYRDYIKNVASSEIYPTWPRSTITANVLAIMSFTLNRIYTEWYRNRKKDFTITSSTAYDHKWIYGRNIFESVSEVVDDIFDSYLSRPGVRQPILTQYCDGRKVKCPGWMTQWGSCELGEMGKSPLEILRYFYGDTLYINTAEAISGIPSSYPGKVLEQGERGEKVRQLQQQLDAVATVYTSVPRVRPDGIYGPDTEQSVRAFQSVFGLPVTGKTDFATWYKISHIYVGISRIGELY